MIATAAVGTSLLVAALLATHDVRAGGGAAALAVGSALRPPRALPAVQLRDESGRPRPLSSFRGRWLVLAPAMTLCHEVCPMTTGVLTQLAEALRGQGLGGRVAVAEATVDPWRDSPARLRAYKHLTGAAFTLLTGSRRQIAGLWRSLGVYYRRVGPGSPPPIDWWTHRPETFDVQHSDGLFILDPAGRERVAYEGMPQVAGALEPSLRGLLDAEGRRNLAHPQSPWSAAQVLDDLAVLMHTAPEPAASTARAPDRSRAAAARQPSPPPLAALHRQGSRLIGAAGSLRRRLAALKGYPVVLNAWASWCPPCRAEFPLFASASAAYGRQVAFVGADIDDSTGAARAFLATHAISYPSYRASAESLEWLAPVPGTPTTIFIDAAGRVAHVHPGQYGSQAALEGDIVRYALGA